MILNTDLSSIVAHINRGIAIEMEEEIKRQLMPTAARVVEEAARKIAKNLRSTVYETRNFRDGGIQMALVINDKREDLPE